jgi:hypothetical protein
MENILLKIKPPPKSLQTDNGKEFFQSLKLIIIVRSVLLKHL